jgi:hypothetical protein
MEWLASLKRQTRLDGIGSLQQQNLLLQVLLCRWSQCFWRCWGNTESSCLAQLVDLDLAGNPLGEDGVVALTARELSVHQALDLTDTRSVESAGAVTAVRDGRVASLGSL